MERPSLGGAGEAVSSAVAAPQEPSAARLVKGPACWHEPWMVYGISLFLAAIVWVVFGQSLGFEFVNYDDDAYVYENPRITGGLGIRSMLWAWTHIHSENWHPLTTLSHMLDCQLYGLQPWGHHLGNVLLQCGVAILLFLAIKRMTEALWRSALVASVFAIHPLRAESVAWVSERKDVLSGIFFMLTLLAYASYVSKRQTKGRLWITSALFALGLMCKPTLVTLPFLLLLLDCWPLERLKIGTCPDGRSLLHRAKPLILEKIPLFVLSASCCVVTLWVQKQVIEKAHSVSFPWRLANAAVAYCVYLFHLFWPVDLAVLVPHPGGSLDLGKAGLAILFLVAVTTACWFGRKRCPWLAVGWLWFLGMTVPAIGIVQVGAQAWADRYTYLPQIGLYVAAAWSGAELAKKLHWPRWVPGLLSASLILALIMTARNQTAYWHDSERLWNHAIACTTQNSIAHNDLGNVLLFQKGQADEAIAHYQKALEISPGYTEAHCNLGIALSQKGRLEEAMAEYQLALEINPACAGAHYNLGLVLSKQGRLEEATAHYQKALEIDPESAQAENNLGLVLSKTGRFSEALSHYQKALEINPAYAQAGNNLAYLLATCRDAQLRNGLKAEELAKAAIRLTGGDNPVFLGTLAAAYAEQGRFTEAVETAMQAIALADAQGNSSIRGVLQEHLKVYQAEQPWR